MSQIRILIIDDDTELRELLSEFFESQGALVSSSERPSVGLKKLREFNLLLRRYSHRSPWKEFVPDLVTTLTFAPDAWP